jgi:hypothetical protein
MKLCFYNIQLKDEIRFIKNFICLFIHIVILLCLQKFYLLRIKKFQISNKPILIMNNVLFNVYKFIGIKILSLLRSF